MAAGLKSGIDNFSNNTEALESEFNEIKRCNQNYTMTISQLSESNEQTKKYFKMAYLVIPFLRHISIFSNHTMFIDEVFSFLDSDANRYGVNSEGYSIAAYAYALNNNTVAARELLKNNIKNLNIMNTIDNTKCLKLKNTNTECDLIHTCYTALAYIALDDLNEAMPIVKWIQDQYSHYKTLGTAYRYAMITGVIYAYSTKTKISDGTNIQVKINDNYGREKNAKLIGGKNEEVYFEFHAHSKSVNYLASGVGYCSIIITFESLLQSPMKGSKFVVTITPDNEIQNDERTAEICAKYTDTSINENNLNTMNNVIYEIQVPSGYKFTKIQNYHKIAVNLAVSIFL
jgi:hypothetical protein